MSIKTNELQQSAVLQGTDTLLLADSAGGTAQLPLAQAAAWFGAEMVKAGNPVGAALSNKAALSAQQTVEKTHITEHPPVSVAGSELYAYIASLPRLLTEGMTINVSGNITSGAVLDLNGFYGGSILRLIQTDPNAVCSSHLNIAHNHILISLTGFHFQDPNPGGEDGRTAVYASYGSQVILDTCSFSGGGASQSYTAVSAYDFADIYLNQVKASGCGHVATAGPGCVIVISKGSEPVSMQNNITGAMVWKGGTVILCPGVPETLGGTSNVKNGGMIVGGDGTLL